jgi:hypothetical protein
MVGFVKFAPPKRRLTWCLIRSNFGMKIDEYPRMTLKTSFRLTVLQLIVFIHYVSKSVIARAKVPLLSRAGRRRDGASRAHYTRYCFAIRFLDFRYERPLPVRRCGRTGLTKIWPNAAFKVTKDLLFNIHVMMATKGSLLIGKYLLLSKNF